MSDSLSLIVPVCNAGPSLRRNILNLLDLLPDFTPRFEVLIVDQGSEDQTEEVASELARQFPQIRAIRGGTTERAAIEAGLRYTTGDVVLVENEPTCIRPSKLRRMWHERQNGTPRRAARTKYPQPTDAALIDRLIQWGAGVTASGRASELPPPGASPPAGIGRKSPVTRDA